VACTKTDGVTSKIAPEREIGGVRGETRARGWPRLVGAVPLLMFSVKTPDDYGPGASSRGAARDRARQRATQARRGAYHVQGDPRRRRDPEALGGTSLKRSGLK